MAIPFRSLTRLSLAALAGCAFAGCAPTLPAEHATAASSTALEKPVNETKAPAEEMLVELAPDARRGVVAARIVTRAPTQSWTLADARGVRLADVVAHDATGPVEVETSSGANGGSVIRARRAPLPPVELRYTVSAAEGGRPADSGCPFVVEPDRAIFCGESAVAIPDDGGAPRSTRIVLRPDHDLHRDGASSFGLADDLVTDTRPEDVARAAFVFGDLGTSELRASEARDHAAWVGYLSFDPRWVAAESAGVRTAVDRWLDIQRPNTDPSVGLIMVVGSHPQEPLQIDRRTRGLFVAVDVSAAWTPLARIRTAQIFTQRTVGGQLWIGSRQPDKEATGAWFSEGVSRAIAVDVLREMEVLTPDEQAAELNSLLVEEALGSARDAGVEKIAERAKSGDATVREEARRALAVRGALLGARIGSERLRKVVRALVARAGETHVDTLPLSAFVDALGEAGGPELAGEAGRVLERGGDVPLAKNALGPCYELTKKTVAPFELGFDIGGASASQRSISRVEAGSAAARAGVLAGDRIVTLAYQPGRADIPVALKVHRESGDVAIRFAPAGAGRPGRAFVKTRDARCRDSISARP